MRRGTDGCKLGEDGGEGEGTLVSIRELNLASAGTRQLKLH